MDTETFDMFKLADGTVNCITMVIIGKKMASIFTAAVPIEK